MQKSRGATALTSDETMIIVDHFHSKAIYLIRNRKLVYLCSNKAVEPQLFDRIGVTFVAGDGLVTYGAVDGRVPIWDPETATTVQVLDHSGTLR